MYTVAQSIEEVNRLLGEGWECQGGVSVTIIYGTILLRYNQAMVLITKPEKRVLKPKEVDGNLQSFVDEWNLVNKIGSAPGLQGVRVITPKMKSERTKLVKEFKDASLIGTSISIYMNDIAKRVKREGSTYHLHRFTFEEFIKQDNGARKFINS